MAYLDENGLEHFWGKIKDRVSSAVAPKANDADVVHKTGDVTIAGVVTLQNTASGQAAGETVTDLVIRNPEVDRGTPVEGGRSYTRVILADREGDTEETYAGRLGLLEVVSPKENDTVGEELRLGCYKYSGNSADYSKYAGFRAGYDKNAIPFSTAPATSDDRTNSTDIVTRGFMEASEWNWQKSKKNALVQFKPVPENDLEPVVDFMFTEMPPAEGEKSPSNPSSIAGVSTISVKRQSKNLLTYYRKEGTGNSIVSVQPDGSLLINGTISEGNYVTIIYTLPWNNTAITPNTSKYIVSVNNAVAFDTVRISCRALAFSEWAEVNGNDSYMTSANFTRVFTPMHENAMWDSVFIQLYPNTYSNLVLKPQLELGTVATEFEPSDQNAYAIQLGDTYYVGSLDVATSVMTVTWVGGLVPVKSFQYHIDGIVGFQWDFSGNPRFTGSAHTDTDLTCTHFPNSTDSSQYPERISLTGSSNGSAWGGYIHISDSRIGGSGLTNAQYLTNMQQYITDNNVIFAAKVYAPFTVQLTPTQIRSLPALDKYEPRVNTVYTDQEAVQVGYQRYANYVDLTTDQFVDGVKTFRSIIVNTDENSASYNNGIIHSNGNGIRLSSEAFNSGGASVDLCGKTAPSNAGIFYLRAKSSVGTKELYGTPSGTLKWDGQDIQVSSDERIKTPLSSVPDAVLDAWEDVNWGQFQYLDAVKEKGEFARLHLGLIAQHVISVFDKRGLDACEYGILCHEEREATEEDPAVDLWMVRYAEAQAMESCCMRRENARLKKRVADLEERLAALELKIS